MKLSPSALLGLLPLFALSATAATTTTTTTTVTFRVPASHALPNPNALPPSTRATLSSPGEARSAALTADNSFVFRNLSAGSYLVDVHCPTHAFAPVRLDVGADEAAAWESFRGNDWDNRGEALLVLDGGMFEVRALGAKGYFMERSKFSILSILRQPMILLGLVSMGIFIGMPYLVDNMDPEMRAEWDERQKSNPMNGIMGSATGQPGANPIGNFDMAAFLAGSSKKDDAIAAPSTPSGNGGGGKKKR